MENQIESDMELRNSLNRDLRVRKQVEDLFYLINPDYNLELGISKHVFLRSVQLDENVRSALLVWPQLKVLGQPKLYINAFKRLDTNEDNYVSVDELSHFIRCGHHVDKSGAKQQSFQAEKLEAIVLKLFGLVHVEANDSCSINSLIDAFNTDTSAHGVSENTSSTLNLQAPMLQQVLRPYRLLAGASGYNKAHRMCARAFQHAFHLDGLCFVSQTVVLYCVNASMVVGEVVSCAS